jgi:hypothetical protein
MARSSRARDISATPPTAGHSLVRLSFVAAARAGSCPDWNIMAKLADRQRKLQYVDHEGRIIDGGWGLRADDFAALTDLIVGRPRLAATTHRLDVPVLVHDVRQAARLPFTSAQLFAALAALDEWTRFSNELIATVDEATRGVEGTLTSAGSQRCASIGVSGRLLWGICSLAVPPPVGVALGAVCYAAIEDTWTDGLARLTEWTLQMPMVFDANQNVAAPTYANRYRAGNTARFPSARNPGGQEKVKDVKDFNQMMKGVEKLFGGDRGELISRWNGTTLANLWGKLPRVEVSDSEVLKQLFRRGCELAKQALSDSVEDLLKEVSGNEQAATRIVLASAAFQNDVLIDAPAHRVHDIVRSGIQLYMNTVVHILFTELLQRATHHRAPVLGDARKRELGAGIERYLLARYFVDNTAPPWTKLVKENPGNVQRLNRYQADIWANTRGTVPEKLFAPTIFSQAAPSFLKNGIDGFFVSPLEKKLVDLDILRKVPNENAVAAWVPGSSTVLYHTIDFAARGRIAEWAARHLDSDPLSAMKASFLSPVHAARVRRPPQR